MSRVCKWFAVGAALGVCGGVARNSGALLSKESPEEERGEGNIARQERRSEGGTGEGRGEGHGREGGGRRGHSEGELRIFLAFILVLVFFILRFGSRPTCHLDISSIASL